MAGGKNQNPNKFLGFSTKPNKKSLDKNYPTKNNRMPNFRALWILTTLETLINIFCFINNITQNDCNFRLFWICKKRKKKPYVNQATQKHAYQIFQPKKILLSKISNPQKILGSSPSRQGIKEYIQNATVSFQVFILCLRYIRIYICFSIFPTNMWYLKYVKIPIIDFAILLF